MPNPKTKRKPRIALPLREGVSYGIAAKRLGCSRQHVYLVCRGERESRVLVNRLHLENLLAYQEQGIGRN